MTLCAVYCDIQAKQLVISRPGNQ